jgi:hypothetical protein
MENKTQRPTVVGWVIVLLRLVTQALAKTNSK